MGHGFTQIQFIFLSLTIGDGFGLSSACDLGEVYIKKKDGKREKEKETEKKTE